MNGKEKLAQESVISFTAVFVAAMAFGLTFWQGCQTVKHNKLSVMPHLGFYWNGDFTNGKPFGLSLSNSGLGPAKVRSFEIFVDGEKVDGSTGELWGKANSLLPMGDLSVTFNAYFQNATISTDHDLVIAGILRPKELNSDGLQAFITSMERVVIEIKYESMYEDQKLLRWNGKNLSALTPAF